MDCEMNRRQLLAGIAAIAVVGCKKTEAFELTEGAPVTVAWDLSSRKDVCTVHTLYISDLPICGMPTSVLLNGERFEIVNNEDQFYAI